MPTPITGQGRITIPYIIDGLQHQFRMYVGNPTLSGGTYRIDVRPDIGGTADWGDAADSLAEAMSNALPIGTTAGTAVLDVFDGLIWNPVDTEAVGFPNLAGSTKVAGQVTGTFRDTGFHLVKPEILEGNTAYPNQGNTLAGGGAALQAFLTEFTIGKTLPVGPYDVAQSVWGNFLRVDGFVSFSSTLNHRLEKARGL